MTKTRSLGAVSVVIPAYNAERWLGATLESVLAQADVDLEVLVVDDGSTDATQAVVARFPLVRYLRKTNGGQASARNLGIQSARGEYIAFIDADDVWFPNKLGAQIEMMQKYRWDWCYCDGVAFAESLDKVLYNFSDVQPQYHGDVLAQLLLGNFIPSPSPVVRRVIFEQVGLFNEAPELRNREDWEMWLRIAECHRLGYLAASYFGYRLHTGNGTRNEDHAKALESKLRVIGEAISRNQSRLKSLERAARLNQIVNSAKAALRGKQNQIARKMVMNALKVQRSSLTVYALLLLTFGHHRLIQYFFILRERLRLLKFQSRKVFKRPMP